MATMQADFTMYSGDTKSLDFTILEPDDTPVDISGKDIIWSLSPTKYSSLPLITKGIGTGITITDGPAGKFSVLINALDTAELQGDYYHEALLDDNDTISTIVVGSANILATLL